MQKQTLVWFSGAIWETPLQKLPYFCIIRLKIVLHCTGVKIILECRISVSASPVYGIMIFFD